jgi:hypothetical protein
MGKTLIALVMSGVLSQAAVAGVCDYTPSKLIGSGKAKVAGTGAAATAGTGIGMQAAGLYTIVNATTGATMLGSTAAGASAAGTVGIIGGTAGVVGSVGAFLMSPLVIIPAAALAVGGAAYEGTCYLAK